MKGLPFGRSLDLEGIRIQDILTEGGLRKLLEMDRDEFERFRKENDLPFIQVTEQKRLYFGKDVVELFGRWRIVPGRSTKESG